MPKILFLSPVFDLKICWKLFRIETEEKIDFIAGCNHCLAERLDIIGYWVFLRKENPVVFLQKVVI